MGKVNDILKQIDKESKSDFFFGGGGGEGEGWGSGVK